MKDLKDWSKQISGLESMDKDATLALYSDMLATAHDIGHKVPDDQLIETEDAAKLKAVIPALHEGIKAAHAAAKKKKPATEFAPTTSSAHTIKASELKGGKKPQTAKAPKKPAKAAAQKEPTGKTEKETMGSTAAKKAPAKKAAKGAKKAAPAKKGKKAAAANARTGVGGRNPFGENAVIKVLTKETGIKEGSERYRRVAVVLKYNGKKVADFYAKEQPPLNRTDTLRFLIDRKIISIK